MKVLVLYSSCEGQTLKIARYLVEQLNALDKCDFVDLEHCEHWPDYRHYEQVIIGASIRYGKFRPQLYRLLDECQDALSTLPCAFFGVCLTARKSEKSTPSSNLYMQKLNKQASWMPRLQAVFAGALLYSRYNWWQTRLIQLIMKITGGSTDRSKDLELTDWAKVAQFAKELNENKLKNKH